jgi:hypothetical protein
MAKSKKGRNTESVADEKPKSDALQDFKTNLDALMAFVERLQSDKVFDATKALVRAIKKETAAAPQVNIKRLERETKKYKTAVDKWIAFHRPAVRSMSVMLVSFIEAYLEQGLVSLAAKNPRLVKAVEIECRRVFEVESIDELRNETLWHWAHDALRPGGPETWFRRLRDMGAPTIDQEVIRKVQHLWDTRNLIVHSRCIASVAYAKKYAQLGIRAGTHVPVNLNQFGIWLNPVRHFIEWSDAFFLAALLSKNNLGH